MGNLVTPSRRYPLGRGWKYMEVRGPWGTLRAEVVFAPSPWDRLVLRWQRAWRSWRRPR